MKKQKFLGILILAAMALPTILACGGSDSDGDDNHGNDGGGVSNSAVGWYVEGGKDDIAKILDLYTYDNCYWDINSNGELVNYKRIFTNTGVKTEFQFNFSTSAENWDVLNIVDKNTIVRYRANVYFSNARSMSDKTKLYTFGYNGLAYLLALYPYQSWYYTYWIDDGKLYTTEPSIFTITSNGLIRDGSSKVYVKYDPDEVDW